MTGQAIKDLLPVFILVIVAAVCVFVCLGFQPDKAEPPIEETLRGPASAWCQAAGAELTGAQEVTGGLEITCRINAIDSIAYTEKVEQSE